MKLTYSRAIAMLSGAIAGVSLGWLNTVIHAFFILMSKPDWNTPIEVTTVVFLLFAAPGIIGLSYSVRLFMNRNKQVPPLGGSHAKRMNEK